MSNNDLIISKLKKDIKDKRKELGSRPKVSYKGDGVVYTPDTCESQNLNALPKYSLIHLLRKLLLSKLSVELAEKELQESLDSITEQIDDDIYDIKERLKILSWIEETKKLNEMDKELEGLLSDEAKTASILDRLSKKLGA